MNYILGIDLGANSIGWAAVRLEDGLPCGFLKAGVRVFPSGVDGLEQGKDESRATQRRVARLQRRQTDRRRRRAQNVYRRLASLGLLPRLSEEGEKTAVLTEIDRRLTTLHGHHDLLPYFLRARALDQALEPLELGRALYHLSQRRGFLSNRKAQKESEDERGVVKKSIVELEQQMHAAGARTLGEYLATLNPQAARIRQRYTHRAMYLHEFEQIWAAQTPHHPAILTDQQTGPAARHLLPAASARSVQSHR